MDAGVVGAGGSGASRRTSDALLRRFPALERPGAWFAVALAVGAAARVALVVGTGGTLDVDVWEGHAWEINQKGLIGYYHGGQYRFNHPPLMGEIFSRLYVLAAKAGVPFAVFLRAPFALLDAGTAFLVLRLLGNDPRRYLLCAAYWLLPLAIVFSAYHGNTDAGLAFFLVGAVVLVARDRPIVAGALLGVGLWIKLPAVLAFPALAMGLTSWPERLRFAASTAVVGIASYVPALLQDAAVVIESVFLYPGLQIRTPAGVQVWGPQLFYPDAASLPEGLRDGFERAVRSVYLWNTAIVLAGIGIVAWARRHDRGALAIAGNVGASYAVFHGLTNFWAWQYLAWALPLWVVAGGRFAWPAAIVTTAYVYGLNLWLTDSVVLAGSWDFLGKPRWPAPITWARDVAYAFFLVTAVYTIARSVRRIGSELR